MTMCVRFVPWQRNHCSVLTERRTLISLRYIATVYYCVDEQSMPFVFFKTGEIGLLYTDGMSKSVVSYLGGRCLEEVLVHSYKYVCVNVSMFSVVSHEQAT